MPLTLRMIGLDDYTVHEDRQLVGRIRYANERSRGFWLWTCIATLPGPPFREAGSLDEAKRAASRSPGRTPRRNIGQAD